MIFERSKLEQLFGLSVPLLSVGQLLGIKPVVGWVIAGLVGQFHSATLLLQLPGVAAIAGKAIATTNIVIVKRISHTLRIVFPPFDSSYITGYIEGKQPVKFAIDTYKFIYVL